MKTFYYKRTILYYQRIEIPDFFINLDNYYDQNCQNLKDAYLKYGLKYPENILKRYADIKFFSNLIRREYYENKNPFEASLLINTYLVGYFNSLKSFLDAVAVTLNDTLNLGLKPIDRDLCRKRIWTLLPTDIKIKYEKYKIVFKSINDYRNAASHRFYPIIIVRCPSSVRLNRTPSQISREEVDIMLVDNPENDTNILFDRENIKWENPILLMEDLNKKIQEIANLIIDDFIKAFFLK
ncbi:MAG: hypothetical protein HZC46_04330 [Ignavibacterium album]|uniref:hypothetical protein n=1 Tax=Ignavibacterium album TaxID=591197 RepID=UPI0026EE7272|nr:hypothetical protein [Ignavibacterium album]MBI5661358.1 hypothetical protein [Ignavibacterium album]